MLDVYVLRLQVMSNLQIPSIFDFQQARPLAHAAHALNKGAKNRIGTSATYFAVWVDLKTLHLNYTKTHARQESFEKMCGRQFFARPHSMCHFQDPQ